ncbi:hypothetical protein SAMN05216188_13912 [Lentzea xinjiangensis]|uniref:Uncharacterized protein n=1 Tax=Lentzea xinjiangensis TaxID=402600 RepID=A0A1H9WQ31_9PSEU|nr:hypothetical protein SAMN05216188_13912 [Lentzea xinjiangensis]
MSHDRIQIFDDLNELFAVLLQSEWLLPVQSLLIAADAPFPVLLACHAALAG